MTRPQPGQDATPLDGVDEARWQAVRDQTSDIAAALADGTLDAETLEGGLAALAQVPLDASKVLDAIHLPEDAGEHAAGLERILRRIPDGWGRWIGCGPGWYPLITELDRNIATLLPEYEIHQVKEKYGTLRFYWGMPWREPACCIELAQADPRPLPEPVSGPFVPEGRTTGAQRTMDEWFSRVTDHLSSSAHAAGTEALHEETDTARQASAAAEAAALVAAAEKKSAHTCEQCGAAGRTYCRGGWLKTLCPACAAPLGYTTDGT